MSIGVPVDLKEFLDKTKNLQEIKPEIIKAYPESIRFIRVLLGLFQSEFGRLCGKDRKRISENELGIHKPNNRTIRKILTQRIIKSLKEIKNPEDAFEQNLKLLNDMRLSGIGRATIEEWKERGVKTGFIAAETTPLTQQELELRDKLRYIQKRLIWHINISNQNGNLTPLNVDLKINPNILVLLRRVKTLEKKNLERHATQLALDALRLKKRVPEMKVFCLFETNKLPNKAETVLNECLDWWTTSIDEFAKKVG